jgi:hypothetical protein
VASETPVDPPQEPTITPQSPRKALPNPYVRRLLNATGVSQDTASQEAQHGCQRAIAAVDEPGPGFPSAILRKRRAVECQALSGRAGSLASRTTEAQPTRKSLSDSLFQSFERPAELLDLRRLCVQTAIPQRFGFSS